MFKHFLSNKYVPIFLAAAIVCVAFVYEDDVRRAILHNLFHIHSTMTVLPDGRKALAWLPFSIFFTVRCAWYLLCFALLSMLPGFPLGRMTLRDAFKGRRLALGFATGTAVMGAAIVTIIGLGDAHVAYRQDSTTVAVAYLLGWIGTSLVGALAEEVLYRGLMFSVLDRIGGRTVAMVLSAFAFTWDHVGNDGASTLWLVRLSLQGLLLAYAVVRTRSLWWSVGYHAGWNWASAPLFGAAGSGYANQGHFLTFEPTGSAWITGAAAGPEGSLFAFAAMLLAWSLLRRFTPPGDASSGRFLPFAPRN